MPDAKPRCVLIFRMGSLGDTLLALPAFYRIRDQEPHARIVLFTNAPVDGGIKAASSAQVLAGTGLVDDFIQYPLSPSPSAILAAMAAIRRLRAARTIYLMPVRNWRQCLRDLLFFAFAGSRKVEGLPPWREIGKRWLLSNGMYESEAARLYRLVGGKAMALTDRDFSLRLSQHETDLARARLRPAAQGDTIAISIGTKAPANDWGDGHWQELLATLANCLPDARLVLIGSASESARSQELARPFQARVINLCGQLSPRESGAVLAQCDLFIGHDSGPMHLAAAVGTPLVAIFSARFQPGIWFPFSPRGKVFYNPVTCAGCALKSCVAEQMRCIRAIAPQRIAASAIAILDGDVESLESAHLARYESKPVELRFTKESAA